MEKPLLLGTYKWLRGVCVHIYIHLRIYFLLSIYICCIDMRKICVLGNLIWNFVILKTFCIHSQTGFSGIFFGLFDIVELCHIMAKFLSLNYLWKGCLGSPAPSHSFTVWDLMVMWLGDGLTCWSDRRLISPPLRLLFHCLFSSLICLSSNVIARAECGGEFRGGIILWVAFCICLKWGLLWNLMLVSVYGSFWAWS